MILGPSEPTPTTVDDLLGPELASQLARLDVASRRVFAGRLPGERRSKRRGQSVEFDDYRPYVAGDDLRHVDWNVFARTDRFFLKLFREEEDVTVEIVLDLSPSMDVGSARPSVDDPARATTPSKRLFAARLAMALAYVALTANNRVRLTSFGRGFHQTPAARGKRQIARFAQFLLERLAPTTEVAAAPAPESEDPLLDASRRLAQTRQGSGVVVVLSDLLSVAGPRRALGYLAAAPGFEVAAIQTLAPSELDPALEPRQLSGDLRLLDIESGSPAEITVTPELLDQYRDRVRAFVDATHRDCSAVGVEHLMLTTDTPLDTVILRRLRARGLLR